MPVIILNLQPGAAIDYASFNRLGDLTRMTGEWLVYCAACPVPEIANVFGRNGVAFHQITGILGDDPPCSGGRWTNGSKPPAPRTRWSTTAWA